MTGKINMIILVMLNCCSTHVVKRFYQADFNAFSLQTQVRLLSELVKGSNLLSLYCWCLQIVVCIKSSFFLKRKFIFKNCLFKSRKNVSRANFYHCLLFTPLLLLLIWYIIHCCQKKVWHNLEKKLIKVSQEKGRIIYLCKSVGINFILITFKILSKFQDSSCRKDK